MLITFPIVPKNPVVSFANHCFEALRNCTLSEKTRQLAIGCFKVGASLYLGTFGTTELAHDFKKKQFIDDPGQKKVDDIGKQTLKSPNPYLNLHGGLMLGSGLFGLLDALHTFGIVHLGTIGRAVGAAGSLLFLAANVIALEENARIFNELQDTTETTGDKKERHWLKLSAFLGCISNIGYIITTATLLFSGLTAFTLLAALLSCSAGGLKILFDLLIWAKEHQLF